MTASERESAPKSASATDMSSSSVMEYLRSHGFAKALSAFQTEMEATSKGATPAEASEASSAQLGSLDVSMTELANKNVPRDPREKDAQDTGTGSALEQAGAQALLLDPTDTARGFAMIKSWCTGSLDIYQPELLPLLLPLFVHSYLNMVDMGLGMAATEFFHAHASFFQPMHASLLSHLRSLCLPSHINTDELAQQFRTERYVLKMSPNVFGLLIGWLTDGTSPVGFSSMDHASFVDSMLEPSRRGREAMLKIINERCRIQVLRSAMFQLDPLELEEGTGLTGAGPSFASHGPLSVSRHHPLVHAAAVSESDAIADFNARAAGPQLKLHPRIPLAEDLKDEVDHVLRDEQAQLQAKSKVEPTEKDTSTPTDTKDTNASSPASSSRDPSVPPQHEEAEDMEQEPTSDLLGPTLADLPPQPSMFRTVDLLREVERVRDARKCLRIDPKLAPQAASAADAKPPSSWDGVPRTVGLPSVCMYTFFDAEDGLTSSTFSSDLTLMAAGFEESYVQVWSLKGEPVRELRSDFNLSSIRDRKTLQQHRAPGTMTSRKLIGHSAPVYGVDFDPVGGSGSSPRHLLSCSADGTARLWSLDTFAALVAYRGHQYPLWDVTWGPLGTYFATASADRTARLWSVERINPLRIYAGHLSDVDCLRFHPNSLYLATGSSDRSCRLWDVQRGACVRLFVGHQSPISCLRISSDGRYLASASDGNASIKFGQTRRSSADAYTVSLWDLASGRRIKKMWGHTSTIHDMDFSADGAVLVTGSADNTVRCWDVRTAQESPSGEADASSDCVATYFTKNTPAHSVHFSPRNLCLAAGVYSAST
ncbi:Similar to S.cerevisiae protein TAF5 (Subunit (90 kDa) of TFIID and SAGA complexes) [Malassezia sympodialis ATCC 42132]|uniref:Similar to S.cerevisiae protein TAF5 (Subunit (90 kDa) of TFIID and SAGA complexes) n=2 Tax=Malassezia sympodialis (strain ATCC 42132) TaxID=1230383 RepID=A0A1M8A392_MALS4|nr:Similar to S.cerevisiae protein TAF5 (Subunit (90 kDa) of TFIID and SAGA complexes) [Malassezia sympodialis ATCC 42132]